jgi:hypothetical protein
MCRLFGMVTGARHLLADRVFATEPMDGDPGWRNLEPGELVHVDGELNVVSEIALPDPPARPLTLAELHPRAAGSQTHI